MKTENVILDKDTKKELKHLAVDTHQTVSTMLINKANYVLNNDVKILKIHFEEVESFTMKIDETLKDKVKVFCKDKDIRIKDFWNAVANMVIEDTKGDSNGIN